MLLGCPVVSYDKFIPYVRSYGTTAECVCHFVAVHALAIVVMIVHFLEPVVNDESFGTFQPNIRSESTWILKGWAIDTSGNEVILISIVVKSLRDVAAVCLHRKFFTFPDLHGVFYT